MATLTEKFHKPENWDKCDEGTGYVMYCGGNDWENFTTAVWVIFPSDEANRRIWFKIKFPQGCQPDAEKSSDENNDRGKKLAEKARRTWIRVAKECHKNRNHGSRSWKDAFKSALHSKEMQPYVAEHGEEQTQWDDVKESAHLIVNRLLFENDIDPERYVDQAGFRRFILTFDFGAGEGQRKYTVDVPRHRLVGRGTDDIELVVRLIGRRILTDLDADDWDWLVDITEENPVDPDLDDDDGPPWAWHRVGEAPPH
jgi:hypothetical protein